MEFSSSRFADVVVATVAGRIDHTNAEDLQSALAPLLGQTGSVVAALVLNFERLEYASSAGLRVLMLVSRQARACQARIAVARMTPLLEQILVISRFNHVLEVFPSVREALVEISPAALAAFDAAQKPASA